MAAANERVHHYDESFPLRQTSQHLVPHLLIALRCAYICIRNITLIYYLLQYVHLSVLSIEIPPKKYKITE